MRRLNCWEFEKCGREPDGANVEQLGVGPAATDKRLHGSNGGIMAGRACWMIAGTFCGGEVQGTFAKKMASCEDCEFYHRVRQEEGSNFADLRSFLLRQRK
jgi:eukaryotic-like serine/threonine-protein kinase